MYDHVCLYNLTVFTEGRRRTDNVCCLQGEEERQLENWEEDIFGGGSFEY